MLLFAARKKGTISFKLLCFLSVLSVFSLAAASAAVYNLPGPSQLIPASGSYCPLVVKGIKLYPDNPFKFDFLIDKGEVSLSNKELKEEARRHINYFLASLTIPEKDLWVNLSPYEKDRIIPQELSLTDMGSSMLKEDYILKQFLSSITHPEGPLGKKFWQKVYQQVQEKYGTANIPVNTFNKVWIVPEKAVVYEDKDMAFIGEARLKVMLEEDYRLQAGENIRQKQDANSLSSQVMKEVILPAVEKEVNQGKHFSSLRQMYHSLILALWYKNHLKDSVLAGSYADQKKIKGIDLADPQAKEKVYNQYLEAYQTGVYDYIKKDFDSHKKKHISRRYFSGGIGFSLSSPAMQYLPAQNQSPIFSSAITVVFEPITYGAGQVPEYEGKDLGFSSPLKLRGIKDLPNNLEAILIVGNWDLPYPSLEDTKLIESLDTTMEAFELVDEVYFTSHFRRPTKKDWQDNRDEFSLIKQVVPVAKKVFKAMNLDAVIVGLPHGLHQISTATAAARESYPGRKLFFVFENNRSYPFQSEYFLGRQPTEGEQLAFINDLYMELPYNCAVVDEAIASHETDATKLMVGEFPSQRRAAGVAFKNAIDKGLRFEQRSADGPVLYIMGGAKGDKVSKHLKEFVGELGKAKRGDTFYIIGALAYAVMRAKGIEVGDSYKHKDKEQEAINRAWPEIEKFARKKGINIFFTEDNRLKGVEGSFSKIKKGQVAIGPGDATVDKIINIVYKIRDSHKGGIFFNGGGTYRKASDDTLKRTDGLIVGAISRTADEGIPVLFSGADTVDLLDKLKSLGSNISDKADVTSAGGTILAGLSIGMSNLRSVNFLLDNDGEASDEAENKSSSSIAIDGGINFDKSNVSSVIKGKRLLKTSSASYSAPENMIGLTFDISEVKDFSSRDSYAGAR